MSRALVVLSLIACSPPPAAKGFAVTITGESSAIEGNPFPPGAGQEVVFRDGWEISYTHVIVTVESIGFSENPDKNPTDPSQTGPLVAKLDGAFAVDLVKGGPLDSKEMNGKSVQLGSVSSPKFDSTTKYAFGFDLIAAKSGVTQLNFDSEADAIYPAMISNGWSVYYEGTATWKGTGCRSTNAGYDWERVPKKVVFKLGWKIPVTYQNCVNPELSPQGSRGVQTQTNDETIAQVTLHLDHPFWVALEEDAPLAFDALAARKSVMTAPAPAEVTVTEADLAGVDFQAFKDAQQLSMPQRICGDLEPGEPSTGVLSYGPRGVPVGPAGLKDFYDYTAYNLSAFGHLNNDGLCYPKRNFAAP